MKPTLADFDLPELRSRLAQWGAKESHAQRVLRAFYGSGGKTDFSELQLGHVLRERLAGEITVMGSRVRSCRRSADETQKLLIAFERGGAVESVLMPGWREDRAAGCVSSQIGCAMGCDFCASTIGGLERNLEAGEIVEQYLHLRRAAAESGRRLLTLVFMGSGEPMHNLENVITAIRRIADPALGELGWRHVTVSTVGIVPGIDRLAEADLGVHLAVSLHAPDDETRVRIVPAGKRWSVAEILGAARRFQEKTGRIPTLEYCLLAGVNDSDEQARRLGDLVEGWRAHVNLIPYNSVGTSISGVIYERPSQERMKAFVDILRARRIEAHFRRTRGDDVSAACGQLRRVEALA